MADKIDIHIDAKVMYQMYEYAAYAKHLFGTEIAGWGHYNRENGIYKLAPLPKQIVSGAEVDTFPNEILKDQTYDISDMTVQWHSHVDMGVTPSWQDKKLIREALELYPYLISIIVNCKHQYSAELNIKRSGEITFPDPVRLEVELVTYYDNTEVKKIVKRQCKRPAPIVPAKSLAEFVKPSADKEKKKVVRTYGWNPHYGMGEYIGNDFYPEKADFFIKNVVWNPLKNSFLRETTGEEKIPLVKTPPSNQLDAFGFPDDLDYFPTLAEQKELDKIIKAEDELSEYDIRQIKQKAVLLDHRYGKDFQMVCSSDIWAIQHLKTGTYCEIDSITREVLLQQKPSEWNEFLKCVGLADSDLFYTPGDCVACDGTGKSSKGKKCNACEGTGKIKITA